MIKVLFRGGKDMKFEEFFEEFTEQIILLKDNDSYGWEEQDFFTAVILDYLEEVGEVESPVRFLVGEKSHL